MSIATSGVVGGDEPYRALRLREDLLRGLDSVGFVNMTRLQADMISRGRFGVDLLVHGPPRSGKTAAAAVVALEMLREREAVAPPRLQALFLAPSRELATQTVELIGALLAVARPHISCTSLLGGTPYAECARACARADMACATPGRLCALLSRGDFESSAVRLVVVDEYDLLLDAASFGTAIADILSHLPAQRQIIALSTMAAPPVMRAMLALLRPPASVLLSGVGASVGVGAAGLELRAHAGCAALLGRDGKGVALIMSDEPRAADGCAEDKARARAVRYHYVLADGAEPPPPAERGGYSGAAAGAEGAAADDAPPARTLAHATASRMRCAALLAVLEAVPFRQALVFTTAPEQLEPIRMAVSGRGWPVVALSAAHEPAARERALERMHAMQARVLVCTDVVSRGIHCGEIDLVVHAELPPSASALVSRVGRAAAPPRSRAPEAVSVVVALASELRALSRLVNSAGAPEPQPLLRLAGVQPSGGGSTGGATVREAVAYDDLFL